MRKAAPLGATCRGPKAQDLHPRVQVPAMVVARKPPPPPPPRRTAQLETQAKAAAGQTLPESQESLLPRIAEGTPRVASICKFWVAGTCRRTPCAYTHDFRCKRKGANVHRPPPPRTAQQGRAAARACRRYALLARQLQPRRKRRRPRSFSSPAHALKSTSTSRAVASALVRLQSRMRRSRGSAQRRAHRPLPWPQRKRNACKPSDTSHHSSSE